jgi:anti-sigma-K factor RskA
MNLSRPDRVQRLDALAAAYVLGTLSARARTRLAHIARTDTAVRATIRAWEERLAPFAEAAPPITPAPHVWKRIALRLGLPADRQTNRGPWWARVGFWRGFAVASFVAARGRALALTQLTAPPAAAPIVVVLAAQDQPPALVATMERDSRIMTVKVVGGAPVPPDRSLELWMLPQGAAPRSLGIVPPTGVGQVTLPALPDVAFAGVPALAVSLEQRGGSTSGAPQGPVLYTGRVERLY